MLDINYSPVVVGVHSEEVRKHLSECMKKIRQTSKALHVDHHKETEPETRFREIIYKFNIPYDVYQYFLPKYFVEGFERGYEIDFAIPELKIGFEINGNFHYDTTTWELSEYYLKRKQYIQSFGWKQIDIHYLLCFDENKIKKIIEDALNGKFRYDEDIATEIKDFYTAKEERRMVMLLKKEEERKMYKEQLKITQDSKKKEEIKKKIKNVNSAISLIKVNSLKDKAIEDLGKFLLDHPNYVSTIDELDNYIEGLYTKKMPIESFELLKKRILIIEEHPEIDYSKFGWGEKLGRYFECVGTCASRYVRNSMPIFYEEQCFRRKDPDFNKNLKPSYEELQEQFRQNRIHQILNSGIDFTKEHWVREVTKYVGLTSRKHMLDWLRKYMPEFCEQYLNYDYNRYPTEDTKKQGVSSWIRNRKSK